MIQFEIDDKKIRYFQEQIKLWYDEHHRDFPWRSEKSWKKGLIIELMLQRTRASKVHEIYNPFFTKFPTCADLCDANPIEVAQAILPLGLHNQRAKRLIKIACLIKDISEKPTVEWLKKLPGVGDYTANAVLCFYLNERRVLLDTNFRRVYSRFFGLPLDESIKREKMLPILDKILPKDEYVKFNFGVLDFAFLVCTFYNPKCSSCIFQHDCTYFSKL